MKNLTVLLLFFSLVQLGAQNTFNHQYNLNFPFEVFTSVLPTDSCYFITGLITDTSNQEYKIGNIFIKADLNGEIEIEKTLLSNTTWYETWRGDLISDNNGNLMDVGYKSDTVRSAFLVKYNTEGDTIYTKSYLNPYYPDDTFIVTAALKKTADNKMLLLCGIDSNPDGEDPDVLLLTLDSMGNMVQSNVYGGSAVDIPYSLIPEPDGGAIIGSVVTNWGQVSQNYYSRAHIFKVDGSGDIIWEYQSPFNQLTNRAWDMLKTPDGGLVISSGKGIEHWVNSESGQLRWNGHIFKLNSDHELQWERELRGKRHSASTGLVKMVEAHDGSGYIATGRLIEDVSIGEEVFGSWVVNVSPQGDSLWARYYSLFDSAEPSPSPRPYDLKNTPDGGFVIVGETRPELPTGQVQRAWIMKLDQHGCLIPGCEEGDTVILSAGRPVAASLHLAIYPNPTSDFLNFQLRTPQQVDKAAFRIVSAGGQVVREINSAGARDTHIVPVSGWGAGVYLLQYVVQGEVRASEGFVVLE